MMFKEQKHWQSKFSPLQPIYIYSEKSEVLIDKAQSINQQKELTEGRLVDVEYIQLNYRCLYSV